MVSLLSGLCFARELEVTYPQFGGVQAPASTKVLLPNYIKYIFHFAIAVAGLIAFASLIYGGFLYLTSAGNPASMNEAKDQMLASFLGLLILLASWLILNTINPQLVILKAPTLQGFESGVILYRQGGCPGGASPEETELKQGEDFLRVRYSMRDLGKLNNQVGSIYFFNSGADLKVILYKEKDWEGAVTVFADQGAGSCATGPGNAQSIELQEQGTGVYLCKISDRKECQLYKDKTETLPPGYNDKITYVYFKQPDSGPKYRVILHEDQGYRGACQYFESDGGVNQLKTTWGTTGTWVSSATIFKEGTKLGGGVILYRNISYNKDLCEEQWCKNGKCIPFGTGICNTGAEMMEKCACWGPSHYGHEEEMPDETEAWGDSIHIDGNYIAVLFTEPNRGGSSIGEPIKGECQIFWKSDDSLRDDPIGKCKGYAPFWKVWAQNHGCFKSVIVKPIEK